MSTVLAWSPFLQPAPGVQHWWWLLVIPMALGVSLSYKAIRTGDLRKFPRDVTVNDAPSARFDRHDFQHRGHEHVRQTSRDQAAPL